MASYERYDRMFAMTVNYNRTELYTVTFRDSSLQSVHKRETPVKRREPDE